MIKQFNLNLHFHNYLLTEDKTYELSNRTTDSLVIRKEKNLMSTKIIKTWAIIVPIKYFKKTHLLRFLPYEFS